MRCLLVAWSVLAVLISSNASAGVSQVKNIVVIFQENRTPDNLFHGLKKYIPSADIADYGFDSTGAKIMLTPVPLDNTYDLGHIHKSFAQMYNNGKMNGADKVVCSPNRGTTCPSFPQFRYVDYADVAPYFDIARNYGFANRMFQTNQGPSFPAHQFIISGTSAPTATSNLFASENTNIINAAAGCLGPSIQTVNMIDPTGSETTVLYPCFEHKTLNDLLDHPPGKNRSPIGWRYYAPSANSIWTAPNAIRHICSPSGYPRRCNGSHWVNGDIVLNPVQVLTDIQSNSLPPVSWVIPSGDYSDHAGANEGEGPSWVASIVNAIGNSPYWNNTVILITWDDWGGWYDHVAPPIDDHYGYYEYGFRVPLLVVSPYTPAGYVSQKNHDFGSILHFIESVFDLGFIPPGFFADSRADDLSDFFDFTKAPRSFVSISSKLDAQYFIGDRRPLKDPDND